MRDPLSDAFEIDDDSFVDDMTYEEIDIPEIKELEFTISRALTDYKEIKEVIQLIEPKNRLKYFEMARDFLDLAKDAMYKRDMLKIKREELDKKALPKPNGETPTSTTADGVTSFSREQLEQQRKLKAV
ncbi:hypothetical protein [Alishewanella phage vB_AspM_Slickus01]|nr:hypothetical protein [Alishewanella phage vB_AspM_Slicko01]WGH49849.1 hypothetical protein [Alishewanella phage vB_AspM_Slickus01]